MKRVMTALILLSVVPCAFAVNFNSISVQGQLSSTAPLNGVQVDILSGGDVVSTASGIDLIPDADGIFSTQTYIAKPWIFQTGSDFSMRLSTGGYTISTFSITAVPFAITVRGDAQTGDQNIFGAYGNVGIGTDTPVYRLVVSSGAGESGNMVVISTGNSNVVRMTGAGEVYANKYYGDGSSLTGVTIGGDDLGNHTATKNLDMDEHSIVNIGGIDAEGEIVAARYRIGGSTVLAINNNALSIGESAGRINSALGNSFVGNYAGDHNTTGSQNTFLGANAGGSNTTGWYNSYIGANSSGGPDLPPFTGPLLIC